MKKKTDHKNTRIKVKHGKSEAEEEKQADDWKNKYLRVLADYQNLEKRVDKRIEDIEKNSARRFILKILPVIDDLLKAQKEIKDPGLQHIINKLNNVLQTENVKRIDSVGQTFDPDRMECVGVKQGEKEGIVIEEIHPAYSLNGQFIRVAQVIVGGGEKKNG